MKSCSTCQYYESSVDYNNQCDWCDDKYSEWKPTMLCILDIVQELVNRLDKIEALEKEIKELKEKVREYK